MTPEERGQSSKLVYQYLPSRYGMNPDDLRKADAIEMVVGQGAKPGGGGMLLGQKISDRVAEMRTLPKGIDQRSACRHPDWTGPDDLEIKILELREITGWKVPIYVKVGATRPYFDTTLAVKAGADVVVIDGMEGGTAATQDVFIEHVGLPTLACIRPAVKALQDLGMHREVQLVVSGGIRNGAKLHQLQRLLRALVLGLQLLQLLDHLEVIQRVHPHLTLLQLRGNHIKDQGAKSLAQALKKNTKLGTLNLRGNTIGDEGGKAFAEALTENPKSVLKKLWLISNRMDDKTAEKVNKALELIGGAFSYQSRP